MVQNRVEEQIQIDTTLIVKEIVDFLLPILTPVEFSYYLLLFRNSYIENGFAELCMGKRTMREKVKGVRSEKVNFQHITVVLKSLELKGCIKIGDTTRLGTFYTVILPHDIPSIKAKINEIGRATSEVEENYFEDPAKREMIFERDQWICQYCGEKVNENNLTLDHYIPVSKNGKNTADNLKTCCLVCNSLKSGKTFEEAAPLILNRLQERRSKVGL